MAKIPKISEAEWQVMSAIWDRAAPVTGSEVADALARRTGWSPRTVKTLLARLVKKGALRFEADGNRYLYRPAVSREACVRTETRSFLKRVFGGDVAPMLARFVEDADLTPAQIRELRKLLERKDA